MMTTKEQIIQALDHVPADSLGKVLELIQTLQSESVEEVREEVWNAYLASERERKEVYRRLAE
jgi:hypothetical protein